MTKTIITLTTTQIDDTVISQQISNEKDIRKTHTVIDDCTRLLTNF